MNAERAPKPQELDGNPDLDFVARGNARRPMSGEPDRAFERRMLIARLRWQLERAALSITGELRRDGLNVSAVNIEGGLITRVANAQPRSSFIPWDLPDSVVLATIRAVAAELAEPST